MKEENINKEDTKQKNSRILSVCDELISKGFANSYSDLSLKCK